MSEIRGSTIVEVAAILDEVRRLYMTGQPIDFALYSRSLEARIDLAVAVPAVRLASQETRHA